MVRIELEKIILDNFKKGYKVKKITYENEDKFPISIAIENNSIYCADEKIIQFFKDSTCYAVYEGKILNENEYKWLKTSLLNHKILKQIKERLNEQWHGVEVIKA